MDFLLSGIHELTESNSPAASPQLHRKSIAGPVNIGLGSLLNRYTGKLLDLRGYRTLDPYVHFF